eukprot:9467451-Pyramimonas_sp.AAC.2
MAPKKRPAPKDGPAPVKPVVSPIELAAAKAVLKDEAELKRQRSSMSHWLKTQGAYDTFKTWSCPEKKEFLETWYAKKLVDNNAKVTQATAKEYKLRSHNEHNFQWVGKEQMQKLIGENKADLKIASGVLQTRPDPTTGRDDEWSIEYKLYFDSGGDDEENIKSETLNATAEVDGQGIEEANAFMTDIASCLDLDTKKLDGVKVKKENNDDGTDSGAASSAAGVLGEGTEKYNVTMVKVKSNVKAEFSTRSEHLLKLKEMFEATKNNKFLQPLHNETQELIPKAAKAVKSLEQLHLQTSDGTTVGDDVYLAVAMQIDAFSSAYTEVIDWYKKLNPSKATKPKKSSAALEQPLELLLPSVASGHGERKGVRRVFRVLKVLRVLGMRGAIWVIVVFGVSWALRVLGVIWVMWALRVLWVIGVFGVSLDLCGALGVTVGALEVNAEGSLGSDWTLGSCGQSSFACTSAAGAPWHHRPRSPWNSSEVFTGLA